MAAISATVSDFALLKNSGSVISDDRGQMTESDICHPDQMSYDRYQIGNLISVI